MSVSVIATIITVLGSAIVAAITFCLTKKHELSVQWRNEKLNHYKALFSSISELADNGIKQEGAGKRFALAVNTIFLVAPQYVISALMDFCDEIQSSNLNKSSERHDELLKKLVLAVRKDIGLVKGDNIDNFKIHLMSS
ncbi:hypothetical protein ACFL3G_09155 [Planctomycetota bacterium]